MQQYTQKELDEKIKAFLTSKKVHEHDFYATQKEKKRVSRGKPSLADWLIPIQLKTQWW